uniref:Uncharacterized protein n=1 Tax=Noccaea caerulescens TaxID=107243 RepID=A0A1J3GWJ8_NOCCA
MWMITLSSFTTNYERKCILSLKVIYNKLSNKTMLHGYETSIKPIKNKISGTYKIAFTREGLLTSEKISGLINILSQFFKSFTKFLFRNKIGVNNIICYWLHHSQQFFNSRV